MINSHNLPSRTKAVNILQKMLEEGVISSGYSFFRGSKKKFQDNKVIYILNKEEKNNYTWGSLLNLAGSFNKPIKSFLCLLHINIKQVQHLETKNEDFLPEGLWRYSLICGKDEFHFHAKNSEEFFNQSDSKVTM